MTQNQIAWAKLNEEKRHNVVSENETARHNVQDETIRYEGNQINREANTINQMHFERMDEINREHYERSDYENRRHNMESEDISRANIRLGYAGLDETQRHNIAVESQQLKDYKEVKRHNKVVEKQTDWSLGETQRHNMATESIGATQASASMAQAGAAYEQARVAGLRQQADYTIGMYNARTNETNARVNQRNARTRAKEQKAQEGRYDTQNTTEILRRDSELNKMKSETWRNWMQPFTDAASIGPSYFKVAK